MKRPWLFRAAILTGALSASAFSCDRITQSIGEHLLGAPIEQDFKSNFDASPDFERGNCEWVRSGLQVRNVRPDVITDFVKIVKRESDCCPNVSGNETFDQNCVVNLDSNGNVVLDGHKAHRSDTGGPMFNGFLFDDGDPNTANIKPGSPAQSFCQNGVARYDYVNFSWTTNLSHPCSKRDVLGPDPYARDLKPTDLETYAQLQLDMAVDQMSECGLEPWDLKDFGCNRKFLVFI